MIKEEKDINFYTTGRQPSEQEFARISERIKKEKAKKDLNKSRTLRRNISRKNIAAHDANTTRHQQ